MAGRCLASAVAELEQLCQRLATFNHWEPRHHVHTVCEVGYTRDYVCDLFKRVEVQVDVLVFGLL